MSLRELVDNAVAAKVIIYDRPDRLDINSIDAPIRKAVTVINESGWVFTAESCSGHPDAAHKFVWGFNKPYLRLTTYRSDMGMCLDLLTRAGSSLQDDDGLNLTFGIQIFRYPDAGAFAQVGVYINAATVWERDTAMRIFEEFGALCCKRRTIL